MPGYHDMRNLCGAEPNAMFSGHDIDSRLPSKPPTREKKNKDRNKSLLEGSKLPW